MFGVREVAGGVGCDGEALTTAVMAGVWVIETLAEALLDNIVPFPAEALAELVIEPPVL